MTVPVTQSRRKAEGMGLEPTSPGDTRFSSAARPTVSGYLPSLPVDRWGIEPGFPECKSGVFPLDHEPVFRADLMVVEPTPTHLAKVSRPQRHAARIPRGPPGIEPDLPPYQGGVLPKHLQTIAQ